MIAEDKKWKPCYVNFRGEFAGLGQVRMIVPRTGWIDAQLVRIPYVVMNRFGTIVWPNRISNICKLEREGMPSVRIDHSRTLDVGSKTYACPPVHSQDNWSANWKYNFEVGLCQCTMLDGTIVHRLVVDIVDNP